MFLLRKATNATNCGGIPVSTFMYGRNGQVRKASLVRACIYYWLAGVTLDTGKVPVKHEAPCARTCRRHEWRPPAKGSPGSPSPCKCNTSKAVNKTRFKCKLLTHPPRETLLARTSDRPADRCFSGINSFTLRLFPTQIKFITSLLDQYGYNW